MSEQQAPASQSNPKPLTCYHLVLFQYHSHSSLNKFSSIDRALVRYIQDGLDKTITTPPESTQIDVWIYSGGGDAHAAYKLAIDLRHRCKILRAIVPDYAKSAATLLALGADKILMAPSAELGPLDAQIEHPDREDIIVSALDLTEALDFVGMSAVGVALSGGASALQMTGLRRTDVLEAVLRFSAHLYAPMMQKFDPHLTHQAASLLRVAQKYALSMLSDQRHADGGLMAASNAAGMVDKLVTSYPAHGYVIDRNEARQLGLNVGDAEHHPRWGMMMQLHRAFLRGKITTINVIRDGDLDDLMAPTLDLKDDEGRGDEDASSNGKGDEAGAPSQAGANGTNPGADERAQPTSDRNGSVS